MVKSGMLRYIELALIVLALDQITKEAILTHFSYGEQLALIPGFFNLTLAYNPGAAFSLLADAGGWQRYFFTAFAFAVSIGIVIAMKKYAEEKRFCIQLALILGGALGNAVDRLRYGHVVDFIQVYYQDWYYPAFNVADSCICIAVLLMAYDAFFPPKESKA